MARRRVIAQTYGVFKLDYATLDKPFAGKIICGSCSSPLGMKVWNSNDERFRRVVWRCNNKYKVKGQKGCESKHINDSVSYQAFINTFNALIEHRDFFMKKWEDNLKSENALVRYKSRQFIGILKNAEPIQDFDIDLFYSIIEKMTVFEGEKIIVSLLDGTEIEVVIE